MLIPCWILLEETILIDLEDVLRFPWFLASIHTKHIYIYTYIKRYILYTACIRMYKIVCAYIIIYI